MRESPRLTSGPDGRSVEQRRLEGAVRAALPALVGGEVESLQGERRWEDAWAGTGPAPQLEALTWRRQSAVVRRQRSMFGWSFRGTARAAGVRVSFYGECLRDTTTGAFFAFRLHSVGLPADDALPPGEPL